MHPRPFRQFDTRRQPELSNAMIRIFFRRASRLTTSAGLLLSCGTSLFGQDTGFVASKRGVVVSVSAPASDVGAAILARGGNAVDAAVATAFALAVTHPSAGNLGGGGFMVIRMPDGTATTIDYRERAPLKATATMFAPGGTLIRALGDTGWLAAGVPGTVRGLELAHSKFGKLPWVDVVRPAAELAARGWPLSPALARSIGGFVGRRGGGYPSTVEAYGKRGGGDWVAGDTIRLPALAHTLDEIARRGASVFYTGWIADSIDAQSRANHGLIAKADLAAYKAVERPPVRGKFLGYDIVAMGPSSSGGQIVIETLNMLEALGVATMDRQSARYLFARIETARRAYYDRARWLGDADFVKVPLDRLLSKTYAESLAKAIDLSHATSSVDLGRDILAGTHESDETTHFSVVDGAGMAVSNTFTLQGGFGNGIVIRGAGFLMNNEMGDFNRLPGETNVRGDIGTPANVIEPGKRMLSAMSPLIISRNGALFMVTGSPGGRTIPNTVIDVILGATAFHQNVRDAVDAPRVHHQWLPDTTRIEAGGASEAVLAELRAKGERVGVGGRGQGDAHSIMYDSDSHTAYGANDRRTPDSKASAPADAAPPAARSGAAPSLVAPFRFRSIGPAGPGGRIDDIAVATSDPRIIYLAYATSGLYRSVNSGTTFEPVFEPYGSSSFGDIAIDPVNPDIVYAGTGEANNRQSSSFGDGIYKTTDGGKTWTNIGLKETQTISRVVIDPRNRDVVYVAANGHLFGPNPDRGIYKTVNGGGTWDKVKFVDENTGFTDLVMDPSNSSTLYAASYQRRRTGCCYNGGGPGSGVWKTTDGGRTWTRLAGNGLPGGTYGRIALEVARSNPRVVYAQIEAGNLGADAQPVAGGEEGGEGGGGGRGGPDWCNNGASTTAGTGRGRGGATTGASQPPVLNAARSGLYRSVDAGRNWTLMSNCDERPLYFSQVVVDPQNANTLYVAGSPASKSLDGGKTFTALSRAGGNGEPGHVDIHAIWVDPRNSSHLMLATDGGLNITWDDGKHWSQVTTMSASSSYSVSADMRRPYFVYTGMQDNGVWGGPSGTRAVEGVIPNSAWFGINPGDGFQTAVDPTDYNVVYGENQNGGANRFDLRTGAQKSIRPVAGGAPNRGNVAPGSSCVDGRIAGGRGGGGRGGAGAVGNVLNAQPGEQYRFNWNTAFALSPHNAHIVWFGGNRLFKSYDRGDTYVQSADLTKQIDRCKVSVMGVGGDKPQLGKNDGVTSYGTIISVSESPALPGVVWAGTDDGNLQLSRDGGLTFTEVGKNLSGLPPGALRGDSPYWVSRIDASHFDAGTAYVAVDGHRTDDMHPYVFVTHDYGSTFRSVAGDLPAYGNVQVIREDPRNRDLLYVGTEFGLFISLDAGSTWAKAMGGFPTVRTDDILVHPRDGDLIVATHGRGVWIGDDITSLQQLTASARAADVYLFDVQPAVAWLRDLQSNRCRPTLPCFGQSVFLAENAPRGTAISYYLKSQAPGAVTLTISDIAGRVVCMSTGPGAAGINRVQWTLSASSGRGGGRGGANNTGQAASCTQSGAGEGAEPGDYTVKLNVSGRDYTRVVRVLEDRWLGQR
jgi:gamma-glutamyltranspeptidase